MEFLSFLITLVNLACPITSNPVNETSVITQLLNNSSPIFTWIGEFKIQVEFSDGVQDRIVLWKAEKIGDIEVRCLFEGTMEKEASADVVISGCMEDDLVSITIHSNHLEGRTMFFIRDGVTEEIQNPYANEVFEDNEYEVEDRSKRSVQYEDYIEEEYLDMEYDGVPDPAPRLKLNVKLGFEESLKEHLGSEEAARSYVIEVFTHGRSYMKHKSLGTELHLNLVEAPTYVANKYWTPRRESITDAKTVKVNEAIPIIYFCFDNDDDVMMGLSVIRQACNPTQGIGILKYRKNVPLAGNTFNHENGHLVGLQHDKKEDEKDGGDAAVPCDGQGFMSEMAPGGRPNKFTTCSARRFKSWLNKYGTCLTEMKIPENLKKCPFVRPSSIDPCTCKIDSEFNTYIFCDSIDKPKLDNLANIFQCKKQVYHLEINMQEYEMDTSLTLTNTGSLEIEYFRVYNASLVTGNIEANAFRESAQILKEVIIQSLPGERSGNRAVVKTEAFSNLALLENIHLGQDFKTLESKAFSELPSLVKLKMEGVKTIEENAFYNLPLLEKLDLSHNEISDLSSNFIRQVPKLTVIDLSNNIITLFATNVFADMPSLAKLYLKDNKIASIHESAFKNLPKLELLDLSGNEMEEVGKFLENVKNKDLIIDLSKTRVVQLRQDSFGKFIENIISQNGAGYVNLESLKLECLCDTKWIHDMNQDSGLTKFHNGICEDGHTLHQIDVELLNGVCPTEVCPGNTMGLMQEFPRSCLEVLKQNPRSRDGIYRIDTDGEGPKEPVNVYCEMSTAGGGWTVMAYLRSKDQWKINIFEDSGTLGDIEHGFTYGKTLMDSSLQFKEKIIIYLALEEEGKSLGRQWMINKWEADEHLFIDSIRTECCWNYRDSFSYTDTNVTEHYSYKLDYGALGFFHNTDGIGYHGATGIDQGCRDGNDICWKARGLSCHTSGKRCALLTQQGEGVIYAVRS